MFDPHETGRRMTLDSGIDRKQMPSRSLIENMASYWTMGRMRFLLRGRPG